MKTKFCLAALGFALAVTMVLPAQSQNAPAAEPAAPDCTPANGINFICGAQRPEDLAQIPGTKWLIASGFTQGAGLKLVDTQSKTLKLWYTAAPAQIRPDTKMYPACPTAPDVKVFNAHGISLRDKGQGRYTLYVVNHGGRQSIDVFDVDARGAEPSLTWTGCVMMLAGTSGNGVASYSDGTILVSVQTMNGTSLADSVSGRPTGGIFEWKPGTPEFKLLPGTSVPGNNGLETSPDSKEFYVIGFGVHTVFVFSRANTASGPVRQGVMPGFMADNLHWDNGRLIMAGMVVDEPACGGVRKVVNGQAGSLACPRGWMVGELDPKTMIYSIVAYSTPTATYNGVASAVIMGGNVYLGSYQSDKIAWRPLPAPMTLLP